LTAGPTYTARTYTRVITDTMCGADYAKMQLIPESKCIRECVRNGGKYAFLQEFSCSMPALYTLTSSREDHFLVKEDICGPLIFHQMKS
jgi:hypothetical protein